MENDKVIGILICLLLIIIISLIIGCFICRACLSNKVYPSGKRGIDV